MYDHIVIGGGTAGCLLAERLSADPGIRVLLLEAGPADDVPEIHIAAAWPALHQRRDLLEMNTALAEESLPDRDVYFFRGYVLGGASSVNNLVYERPTRNDFDDWVRAGGATWTYESVAQALARIERVDGAGGGSLYVQTSNTSPPTKAFLEAIGQVPAPFRLFDTTPIKRNVHEGRRCSAVDAFLRPVLDRPNLTVQLGARADRIVVEDGAARAVEYTEGGTTKRAEAAREIHLCAGALESPKLLMLSGIGPGDTLRALGIPVVVDLEGVGENLQDHVVIQNVYLARGDGRAEPFAEARAQVSFAAEATDSRPDLTIAFAPAAGGLGDLSGPPPAGYALFTSLMRPQSRGRVIVRSNDPRAKVDVRSNFLASAADVRALAKGLAWARQIGGGPSFDSHREREVFPGPDVRSDDELELFVRKHALPFQHWSGTCRMGTDAGAVVDGRLKVRGVDRLRVVDASVMPTIVAAPTLATTLAIAEIAAALICDTETSA